MQTGAGPDRALCRRQPVLPRPRRSEDWLRPARTRVLVHAIARGWSGAARSSWPCKGHSARGRNAPGLEDRLNARRTLLPDQTPRSIQSTQASRAATSVVAEINRDSAACSSEPPSAARASPARRRRSLRTAARRETASRWEASPLRESSGNLMCSPFLSPSGLTHEGRGQEPSSDANVDYNAGSNQTARGSAPVIPGPVSARSRICSPSSAVEDAIDADGFPWTTKQPSGSSPGAYAHPGIQRRDARLMADACIGGRP